MADRDLLPPNHCVLPVILCSSPIEREKPEYSPSRRPLQIGGVIWPLRKFSPSQIWRENLKRRRLRGSPFLPAWNTERDDWWHSSHLETTRINLRMESRRWKETGSSAPMSHCTSLGLLPGTEKNKHLVGLSHCRLKEKKLKDFKMDQLSSKESDSLSNGSMLFQVIWVYGISTCFSVGKLFRTSGNYMNCQRCKWPLPVNLQLNVVGRGAPDLPQFYSTKQIHFGNPPYPYRPLPSEFFLKWFVISYWLPLN